MSSSIIVSQRQKNNPVLRFIRNVRYKVGQPFAGDYQVGDNACVLFLSVQFHILKPDYIRERIEEVKRVRCRLCVLIVLVDVDKDTHPLLEITQTATFHHLTLICAWSYKECARYIETLKAYENKPSDALKAQIDNDYQSRLTDILTSIREVNRTDAATLADRCGSLSGIFSASQEQLSSCPGVGTTKMRELFKTFNEPFFETSESVEPASHEDDEPEEYHQ